MTELGSAKVMDNSLNKLRTMEVEKPQKESSRKEGLRKVSAASDLELDISRESLLNGIIMAEVLGKPRCLRRERR